MNTDIQYFKKQEKIYPRRVYGRYRLLKWAVMILLLAIYYLTPWLRWDRGENLPGQAVLIDMVHTRAYFFGIEIWPQEVYYITGLLILAAVTLFFVTSLFGRVWCGYACPQTVWTDLFIWVERLVQGDRNTRIKIDQSPWTIYKIYKKGLTHLIWLIIALCTGGAWVFYFNDAPTLLDQILHGDIHWSVGGWIAGLTFSTYLMAGFAREQVCKYMCPYARFQSAMFDKNTLIIAYDEKRGEKRGHHKSGESWEGRGHCIDCNSCVIVCPMGIDIREGLQMECIACGLCVDACNNVMDKVGLQRGLIRYNTEHSQKSGIPISSYMQLLLRPRTLYYSAILLMVCCIMVYQLLTRAPVTLSVQHERNPLFITLSDGQIRNAYTISISNKTHTDAYYALALEGLKKSDIHIQSGQPVLPDALYVPAGNIVHFRVFVTSEKPAQKRKNIAFIVRATDTPVSIKEPSVFIGN